MPFDARSKSGTLNTSRGSARQAPSAALAWAAAEMAEIAPDAPRANYDGWTPDLVGEALIEAMRWVRRHGGPAGPRGMSSVQFGFVADLDAHLENGWGIPELAGGNEPEERELILPATPAQVTRHLAALQWPADYLCPDRIGSARMLGLWAACKVSRRSFAGAVKALGVARGMAYQLRDRGLSQISQGLERDRVPASCGAL